MSLFDDCLFEHKLGGNSQFDFSIQAEQHQLEQVFINLFKNAREAMAECEQKHIAIDASFDEHKLVINIRVHGTGIANSENLFIPFYTTKRSGSGIGLALCQQILNNHDSTIQLRNRAGKRGAEVVVRLPR